MLIEGSFDGVHRASRKESVGEGERWRNGERESTMLRPIGVVESEERREGRGRAGVEGKGKGGEGKQGGAKRTQRCLRKREGVSTGDGESEGKKGTNRSAIRGKGLLCVRREGSRTSETANE